MKQYRNTKTGVIVEVNSVISGNGWEPVEAPSAAAEPENKPAQRKPKKAGK